jgi:hypothetical protein
MNKFAMHAVLWASMGAVFVPVCEAQADNEHKVGPRMRVRWNTTTKAMEWAPGSSEDYSNIGTGTFFLSKGAVAITYPRVNPLKIQTNATDVAVPDPTAAIMDRLGQSLTAMITTVVPAPAANARIDRNAPLPGPPAACAVAAATDARNALVDLLYMNVASAAYFNQESKAWISNIDAGLDAGKAPEAIASAAADMRADAANLKKRIDRAGEYQDKIRECAGNADTTIADAYTGLLLAGAPDVRVARLDAVRGLFVDLADALTTRYAPVERWIGSDYRVTPGAVLATSENMRKITLTVTNVSLDINASSDAVTVVRKDLGTSEFTVRKYALFVPEIGVGAVFAKVKPPKYGTATNDKGQMVVAPASGTQVSVNPSILVNFVCRCELGPIAPMVQVGSAVSKDTPAFLLGGGLRLFSVGKGDFAIGGGAMFAWVKDLQTLKPGSVVTGTKDIEADLGFSSTPRIRGYLTLQYKF